MRSVVSRLSPRLVAILTVFLLLGPMLASAQVQAPAAAAAAKPDLLQPQVIAYPRPGTVEAARMRPSLSTPVGSFVRSPSGLYLPDRRIVTVDDATARDMGRWAGTRQAVKRYLVRTGAEMAPFSYQRMLHKIVKRSEGPLARMGVSLAGWRTAVLDGGRAEGDNAVTFGGGLIIFNRDLMDTSRRLATAVVTAGNPAEVDRNIADLIRWKPGKTEAPAFLSRTLSDPEAATRDRMAESIVAGVFFHEAGHALLGHVQLKERKIIIPNVEKPFDAPGSRDQERAADAFAIKVGVLGGAPMPSAIPLLDYYFHMRRPAWVEKGPRDVVDWRTHPLSAERYNNQVKLLGELGRKTDWLPPLLVKDRLLGPDGLPIGKPAPQIVNPPNQ